jgi:CRISP-associated protein Cas1
MILSVQTPGSKIRLRRASLTISPPAADGLSTHPSSVPFADLERVILSTGVSCSTRAIARLLGESISVVFQSQGGKHLGSFEPPAPPRGCTRGLQYRKSAEMAFCLEISRQLVRAKISNARRALQRLNTRRPSFEQTILATFSHLQRDASYATTLETLRGIEGAAAARYFALWAGFLPPAFPFERRSKRPPLNPVNAVLSFISSLVYSEILSACHQRGMDPAPGCLHETTDDRFSLPLDLMEPFRPALVEPLTLRLFTLRILDDTHFKPHGKGVHLNEGGRKLLFEQYEDRLQRPFVCPQSGHRTTFRALLSQAPLSFKMALEDPARLVPFLLP